MNLFIKGFIIGIAKIIPGVSGAMIAVSFEIYDKMINAITHFFDDKKGNFRFLVSLGSGIFLSIVFFSKIIRYLLGSYYMVMMMLFMGLILGGTINFSKKIETSVRNMGIIGLIVVLMIFISLFKVDNSYVIRNDVCDYGMFFIGGMVEIFASIVPGISGTALMMMIGIYDSVLLILGNSLNMSFVIENIMLYISYGVGMVVSFIGCSLGVSYLLKKYRSLFDTIIMGLSISSIILMGMMAFNTHFLIKDIVIGLLMLAIGVVISYLFDK